MGKFNYENWKRNRTPLEEREGFGIVQAWTHEYYIALMHELEKELTDLKNIPNFNRLEYAQGKADMIKRILYDSCG